MAALSEASAAKGATHALHDDFLQEDERGENHAFRKRAESAAGDFLQEDERGENHAFRKRAESAAGDFLQENERNAIQ